jgi:hypothetical protein
MGPTDVTIEILEAIRDECRKTNDCLGTVVDHVDTLVHHVETLGDRADILGDSLDTLVEQIDRLEARQADTEARLTTEIIGVAGAIREVRDLLRDDRALRQRVDDHERRLAAIERR